MSDWDRLTLPICIKYIGASEIPHREKNCRLKKVQDKKKKERARKEEEAAARRAAGEDDGEDTAGNDIFEADHDEDILF